jgi:hypothetical protein
MATTTMIMIPVPRPDPPSPSWPGGWVGVVVGPGASVGPGVAVGAGPASASPRACASDTIAPALSPSRRPGSISVDRSCSISASESGIESDAQ